MTSTAVAAFSFKSFGENGLPTKADVGIATTLRKRVEDATLSLTFTDESLKSVRTGQGVVVGVEKPLGPGLRATLTHDVGSVNTTATLSVNKVLRGQDVQLKATYRKRGDVFILEETWKVDKASRISGSYNFASEEAMLSFTHEAGPWTASAGYNFTKEAPVVGISHRRGPDTLGVVYAVRDDEAALQWSRKPFKAAIKASGISRRQLTDVSANLLVTHEFDI